MSTYELEKIKTLIKKHSHRNKYTKVIWLDIKNDDLRELNSLIDKLTEKVKKQ